MKLSNNSSFVILIFEILKFRNIGRSTFRRSKFWPPPIIIITKNYKISPRIFYWIVINKKFLVDLRHFFEIIPNFDLPDDSQHIQLLYQISRVKKLVLK